MYTVSIETEFSAAHIIRGYNGPCSHPHGHNWKVIVEATTEVLDELGMSVDFYLLQKKTEEVVSQFDHHDLNTTPPVRSSPQSNFREHCAIFFRGTEKTHAGTRKIIIRDYW